MADKKVKVTIEVEAKDPKAALKKVVSAIQDAEKASKKSAKSISTEFIKAAAIIQGIKSAFNFAMKGAEEFDKAMGGGGYTKFSKGLKDIQLQIGSLVSKELGELSKGFENNRDKILKVVSQVTTGVIGLAEIIAGGFKATWNTVLVGIGELASGSIKLYGDTLATLALTLDKLPPGIIPEAWKENLAEAAINARHFAKTLSSEFDVNVIKAAQGAELLAKGIGKVKDAAMGNVSTIGNIKTKEQSDAERKLAKDRADYLDKLNKEIAQNEIKSLEYRFDGIDKFYKSVMAVAITDNQTNVEMQIEWRRSIEGIYNELRDKKLKILADEYDTESKLAGNDFEKKMALSRRYEQNVMGLESGRIDSLKKAQDERHAFIKKEYDDRDALIAKANSTFYADAYTVLKDNFGLQRMAVEDSYKEQIANIDKLRQGDIGNAAKYAEMTVTAEKAKTERLKQLDREEFKAKLDNVASYVTNFQTLMSSAQGINQAYSEGKNKEIDLETENRKAAATATIRNQRELTAALADIDKDAAAKRRKMAKVEGTLNLFQAAASIAQGVIKMLGSSPPPLNFYMAGLVGGMGAIQLGIMASNISKLATGGIVPGHGAGDTQPAMLTPGEVVLNREQQARTLMAIANGSQRYNNATFTMGDTNITINGNADRAMVESSLAQSRQQQMENMRQLLKDMQYHGRLRMQIA